MSRSKSVRNKLHTQERTIEEVYILEETAPNLTIDMEHEEER